MSSPSATPSAAAQVVIDAMLHEFRPIIGLVFILSALLALWTVVAARLRSRRPRRRSRRRTP